MYKIIIAILISAFLYHSAMSVKADMTQKVHTRLATIDNIAK
jgi:hypothetical protein